MNDFFPEPCYASENEIVITLRGKSTCYKLNSIQKCGDKVLKGFQEIISIDKPNEKDMQITRITRFKSEKFRSIGKLPWLVVLRVQIVFFRCADVVVLVHAKSDLLEFQSSDVNSSNDLYVDIIVKKKCFVGCS